MSKVIIFDFDGTIADTLDTIINIVNQVKTKNGYKPISFEEIADYKNLTSQQIIKKSGISIFKIPCLIKQVKQELNQRINNIKLFNGIPEVIQELKRQNHTLVIITSNSRENVITFLKYNNLLEYFDFIYPGKTIFGKDKIIKNFLKQKNINSQNAIYIGDEIRDIEAAKKSNIQIISVTWGFHSKQALMQHQPDFLIETPQEILTAIANL